MERSMNLSKICMAAVMSICIMLLPVGAYAATPQAPNADVTYDQNNDWTGTLVIDASKTVKISNITHENTGDDQSPIKIRNNATVNLVFEGDNILKGNPSKESAGIEVEEGSTVNIYGMDGSSLTVVGGKYSAGIGGIGYGAVGDNPKAGKIHIYSGKITAVGGDRGAGIGSGYHSDASEIVISGGDITAKGSGGGAGIGTGYATSGGAAAPVGNFYSATITITGGNVKAAGGDIDFDSIDINDPDSFTQEDTMAAGIGGGYGAASGVITIGGDAEVFAVGQTGGAGIGSGRGTTKEKNYNPNCVPFNITIEGNAKVTALSGMSTRYNDNPQSSGAAIGGGRGFGLENQNAGTITIKDNATVFAHAGADAQAIGTSLAVGSQSGVITLAPSTVSIGAQCKVLGYVGGSQTVKSGYDAAGKDDGTETDKEGSTPEEVTENEDEVSYIDELRNVLTKAIESKNVKTVYWDKGTALPYDIMKILEDNPDITLVFTYTYQGKNYKATIPGRNVKTDPKIPWYGPLYLNGYYGVNASANANIKPMETGAVYTVKKGDTLSAIARRLNTTVDYLVKVNNIADRDRIREGQILKY